MKPSGPAAGETVAAVSRTGVPSWGEKAAGHIIGSTITSLICEAARQGRARERRAGAQLELALAEQRQAADALRQSESDSRR